MTDVQPARRHSRWGLYAPFILLLLALAAWTGWWFYLARQVQAGLEAQVARLNQSGWDIRHAEASLSGWPFRTRLALSHVTVAAPSHHAVSAPELVAEANAWNPRHWVIVAPRGLVVDRAVKGKVAIDADAIRMSVSRLGRRWPDLALEMVNPVFTAHPGGEPFPFARAARVALEARAHAVDGRPADDDVDVLFQLVDGRGRPDGPVEDFAQEGRLSLDLEAVIGRASALTGNDAAGIFSAWNRAGGTFREVRGAMKAGDSEATLESDLLRMDDDGRLAGTVTFQARDAAPAIAGLARSRKGAVNRAGTAGAAAAAGAAQAASQAATGRESLPLTLVFRDGRAWLGAIPIAPAPKLF